MILAEAADVAARSEGWLWWAVLVGALVILLLALGALRRRLVRPMLHTPTDTTDAWAEAGRRMKVPPQKEKPAGDEDER